MKTSKSQFLQLGMLILSNALVGGTTAADGNKKGTDIARSPTASLTAAAASDLPTRVDVPTPFAPRTEVASNGEALVQVALLLDTSGSMEGLIDQARCQLWNVVSELSKAKRHGSPITLQIAVYQYGSRNIPSELGYLKQVLSFTDNLDEVSAALFSLTVGGSNEHCGQVIGAAINGLEWAENPDVYKAIFIAGNESFDQGPTSFGDLLSPITSRALVLNTIFCAKRSGSQKFTGGTNQWSSAARLVGGLYSTIDHNHHLPEMKTPFDEKMRELNREMNESFVWYGDGADEAAKNQRVQDANARKLSDHAFAARMSAKIGHLYHHVHHDLVDAIAHGKADIAIMSAGDMPALMKKLSHSERMEFIAEKTRQRQAVRRQMADLITRRHAFLEEKMNRSGDNGSDRSLVLGEALAKSIRAQAERKGYVFTH